MLKIPQKIFTGIDIAISVQAIILIFKDDMLPKKDKYELEIIRTKTELNYYQEILKTKKDK